MHFFLSKTFRKRISKFLKTFKQLLSQKKTLKQNGCNDIRCQNHLIIGYNWTNFSFENQA